MSSNIILNKRNIKNASNSVFEYTLPKRLEITNKDDYKIALSHLNVYLSWANITASYGNNKIIYLFWNMSGELVPFEIIIKDGYYTLEDIYLYIQRKMFQNGHYLKHIGTGDHMFFFNVRPNSTYYSHEFLFYSIGQSFVELVDWETPVTWSIPVLSETISIVFPSYGKINEYFGFLSYTVTPTNVISNETSQSTHSILSEIAPQLMPSSSYLILCNLVNNELSEEKRVLTSFTLPSGIYYGDVVSIDANPIYTHIQSGIYDKVTVEIVDQDYRRMNIIDPEMLINLSIIKN